MLLMVRGLRSISFCKNINNWAVSKVASFLGKEMLLVLVAGFVVTEEELEEELEEDDDEEDEEEEEGFVAALVDTFGAGIFLGVGNLEIGIGFALAAFLATGGSGDVPTYFITRSFLGGGFVTLITFPSFSFR